MEGNIIDVAKNLMSGDFTTDITYEVHSIGNEVFNITVTSKLCFLFLRGSGTNGTFTVSGISGYQSLYGLMSSSSGAFTWTYRLAPATDMFTVGSDRYWFVIYFKW